MYVLLHLSPYCFCLFFFFSFLFLICQFSYTPLVVFSSAPACLVDHGDEHAIHHTNDNVGNLVVGVAGPLATHLPLFI